MNAPMTYFRSYPDPFYSDWKGEPVPGWGARPVMAGPRMVAVGEAPASPVRDQRPRGDLFVKPASGFLESKWFYPSLAIGAVAIGAAVYFIARK